MSFDVSNPYHKPGSPSSGATHHEQLCASARGICRNIHETYVDLQMAIRLQADNDSILEKDCTYGLAVSTLLDWINTVNHKATVTEKREAALDVLTFILVRAYVASDFSVANSLAELLERVNTMFILDLERGVQKWLGDGFTLRRVRLDCLHSDKQHNDLRMHHWHADQRRDAHV